MDQNLVLAIILAVLALCTALDRIKNDRNNNLNSLRPKSHCDLYGLLRTFQFFNELS
jgi:hypothetical protein